MALFARTVARPSTTTRILGLGRTSAWRVCNFSSDSEPSSGRSSFKQTPVNPSILKYIESVGVGIPKNFVKRRKKSQPRRDVLNLQEERDQYRHVRRQITTRPPPPFGNSLPVKLVASVGSSEEDFPYATVGCPEVAIAGRSNVGKSTLLNALLYSSPPPSPSDSPEPSRQRRRRPTVRNAKLPRGLKAIASSKPGETRKISFYQLSSKAVDSRKVSLFLVDLPGYGFAFAKTEQAQQWKSLMESYLLDRGKSLKRILLLIDARHGMKKADIDFLESLQNSLYQTKADDPKTTKRKLPPVQIVLTKCDLVHQADLARRVAMVRQQLSACLVREPSALPITLVSAQVEGQAGVLELQKELASLVHTIPNS